MDVLCGKFLYYAFNKQLSGQSHSISYTLDECNADVMIFGNSRAQLHYSPSVFKKTLGLTCYNAGIDGGHSILFSEAIFSEMIKRHHPKIVIFEVDPKRYYYSEEEYDKLAILLPFITKHPDLNKTLYLKGPFEKIKKASFVYRFNYAGFLNIILEGIIHRKKGSEEMQDGFSPRNNVFKGFYNDSENKQMKKDYSANAKQPEIDSNEVAALLRVIETSNQKGIKLYFINSPVFSSTYVETDTKVQSLIRNLILDKGQEYWDYSSDKEWRNNNFFSDRKHLNKEGALKFSNLIANRIKTF